MRSTSRAVFVLFGSLSLAVVSVGCGSSSSNSSDELDKVSIGNYPSSTLTLALEVGIEQGFFEDEGLTLDIVDASSGAELIPALVSDTVDVTVAVPQSVVPALDQGEELVVFPPYLDLDTVLVTKKSSGLTEVGQLAGKKIGIGSLGGTSHTFAEGVLSENGVDPEDVTFISLKNPVTMHSSFANGKVDALAPTVSTLGVMKESGIEMNQLASALKGSGGDYGSYGVGSLWVTTEAFKEKSPETFAKVCTALTKSAEWLADDTNRAAGVELTKEYVDSTEAVANTIWEAQHDRYNVSIDASRWDKNVKHVLGEASLDFEKVTTSCE